jgi:hypothetical protein
LKQENEKQWLLTLVKKGLLDADVAEDILINLAAGTHLMEGDLGLATSVV